MRRLRVSIAWKMTGFFLIFGLLTSYLGLVVYGTIATSALLASVERLVRSAVDAAFPVRTDAAIGALQAQADPILASMASATEDRLGKDSLSAFAFCLRPADEPGAWKEARTIPGGFLRLEPIWASTERETLERCVDRHAGPPVPTFLGLEDSFLVYVDLSRRSDPWLLVLRMNIDRDALLSVLPQHVPLFGLATFLYLCLCVGLAQLFGRSMARPLAALSGCAATRSFAGQSSCLKRRDEVGELARSLAGMSAEIEAERGELADRARMLASMNRIDRAVLESEARMELLDKALSAVLDYGPARLAAVAVRDPDGGGFNIPAYRGPGKEKAVPGGFLSDERFSTKALYRFADPYEIPLAELGPLVDESFEAAIGVKECPSRALLNFVNLPFAAGHLYDGSLVLVREPGGPDLGRLKLLADQVGVALKDIEARESRNRSWMALMRCLVKAVDAKSAWTRGHSERVAASATALGRKLLMSEAELSRLERAAVLHDVGKIGVPETILDKPAALSAEEWALIKRHPSMGSEILGELPEAEYSGLRSAILYHHERWDGSGYPEGLKGEDIPLDARIVAIADVYDAITADRPYRAGMKLEEAREFMAKGAGSLFDPRLVRLFLADACESP